MSDQRLTGSTRPAALVGTCVQRGLPFAPLGHPAIKPMRGSGSADPQHEPPEGVARIAASLRAQSGGQ